MTSQDGVGAASETLVVTVGEFSQRLQSVFRRVKAFEYIGVTGEISEWTPKPNGVYFTLKDSTQGSTSVLQCFAYGNRAQTFPDIGFGSAIVAYGTVRAAAWRSRYELLVGSVRLTGVGELYAQYELLKERFRKLGYFDGSRKRAIPSFPRCVALISARGKGAEDFLTTLGERAPQVRTEFVQTRVQGLGADVEIAEAFDRAARLNPDVIVLARGGGSYEDLFAFNGEPVVRAIVRSASPVITGIGHTGDHHLADDVADLECETPSNAAQFIAGLWQHGRERLNNLEAQLAREVGNLLADAIGRADTAEERLERAWERNAKRLRERLVALERRLTAQSPAMRVAGWGRRLTTLDVTLSAWPKRALPQWKRELRERCERLYAAQERLFTRRGNELALAARALAALDPEKPLERGYAIVTRAGRVLRDARAVTSGDAIEARLSRGKLRARVEGVADNE